ncbi:MAG: protein translocase subunit SecF, partial [Alphaproteobacteria bacterium]|nr:protein translocase subunit SecF [Alphaproteobacteria bacterium]
MKLLKIVPAGTHIDFMGKRMIALVLSAFLIVGSIGLAATTGLNLGIDFLGGILMEVRSKSGPADLADMRAKLGAADLGEVQLQEFGQPSDVLISIQRQSGDPEAQQAAIAKVREVLGDSVDYRRTEFVGPKVGSELREAAIWSVTGAILMILLYIWFRFEWQFGVAAIVALTHDVIATIGVYSLTQIEFNLSTIAALLTIAGYSINDTVVVFDRIRENLRKYKRMGLLELLNLSINDTLSRTVMTSVTTLLALGAIYFFGGEVIRGFSFGMIFGV